MEFDIRPESRTRCGVKTQQVLRRDVRNCSKRLPIDVMQQYSTRPAGSGGTHAGAPRYWPLYISVIIPAENTVPGETYRPLSVVVLGPQHSGMSTLLMHDRLGFTSIVVALAADPGAHTTVAGGVLY